MIKSIKNNEDHDLALARIRELLDSKPGTPEFNELELLTRIVEEYEDEHFPI